MLHEFSHSPGGVESSSSNSSTGATQTFEGGMVYLLIGACLGDNNLLVASSNSQDRGLQRGVRVSSESRVGARTGGCGEFLGGPSASRCGRPGVEMLSHTVIP